MTRGLDAQGAGARDLGPHVISRSAAVERKLGGRTAFSRVGSSRHAPAIAQAPPPREPSLRLANTPPYAATPTQREPDLS
ncbi:hypothetical protein JCM18882A_24450 [Brevibacterium metallidurans]|uniref:Uncharacterized protein n=1 Tax=Brevibacterium metallidurans TaxID=1482676 RepID=A0ABN0SQK7_9MICO